MPIEATTPIAVRSSGSTQRGSRRAMACSTRFSGLASRKLGSRVARDGVADLGGRGA